MHLEAYMGQGRRARCLFPDQFLCSFFSIIYLDLMCFFWPGAHQLEAWRPRFGQAIICLCSRFLCGALIMPVIYMILTKISEKKGSRITLWCAEWSQVCFIRFPCLSLSWSFSFGLFHRLFLSISVVEFLFWLDLWWWFGGLYVWIVHMLSFIHFYKSLLVCCVIRMSGIQASSCWILNILLIRGVVVWLDFCPIDSCCMLDTLVAIGLNLMLWIMPICEQAHDSQPQLLVRFCRSTTMCPWSRALVSCAAWS